MPLGDEVITVARPPMTEARCRDALDAYVLGLGTSKTTDLDPDLLGAGDSVLLRFVLDAAGWNRDHYLHITAEHGSPEVTQ